MIKRLRRVHDAATLREIYGKPYDSSQWEEHTNRVNWTITRLNEFLKLNSDIDRAYDLSCGDGRILREISGVKTRHFGDLVPAEHLHFVGDITKNVRKVSGDLLICSETLEHLDDPEDFLRAASERFKWICVTTPLGEFDTKKNYEHYWGWDLWGISEMFHETDWRPTWVDSFNQPYYTYQFWIARSMWL